MEEYLTFSNNSKLYRFAQSSLVCVEANGNYSTFTFNDGSEWEDVVIQLGKVFDNIEYQLRQTGSNFIQIGRSLIVNRNYIRSINTATGELELYCGSENVSSELFVYKNNDNSALKEKDPKKKKIASDFRVRDEKRTIVKEASKEALKKLKNEMEKNF